MQDLSIQDLAVIVGSLLIMFFLGYLIARRNSHADVLQAKLLAIKAASQHIDTLLDLKQLQDESEQNRILIEKYVPLTERKKFEILDMLRKGKSHSQIAKEFGVHKSTITHAIHKWMKKAV